jgi:diguanylate cyclase (GGDEF)-like protein
VKVLIIDDERSVRDFLNGYLNTVGDFAVEFAGDAAEATRMFETGEPNIILLDLNLGGKTGLEILKTFTERGGTFEVIVMADNSNLAEALNAMKYGAYDFVFKPFDDMDMLERAVRRAADTVSLKLQNEELLRELTQKNLELEIVNRKLEKLSITDDLTGLFNMRYMNEYAPREIMRCERYKRTFALIVTDLDNLKTINDKNGHIAGSSIIKEAGKAIFGTVRKTDTVARFGGDEFLILADEVGPEMAYSLAERIRANIEAISLDFNGTVLKTTSSVGVACFPIHGTDYQKLFNIADHMMYRAKANGKNRVEIVPSESAGRDA